ncbi:FtsX-like permease family protein [Hymenobacter sp. HMF4947]|uniref:FtsX-like permease family protein n=1 Tax=Hymenobacter ginkgonis TaxID=2682976 RepID=A0A7K1TLB4_9BACT|nr:ABC transporter permease [Hymenobacter ginkgonis]MVN79152.1 FtsX-like permease family protein [Hymenobacter ginkgonis]
MLLSYLKIAWKVLLRRKFFTAISLFGISFTLMILLVVYSFVDYTVGPHRPELRTDRLLFATRMRLRYKAGGQNNWSMGYRFVDQGVRQLRTPELVSVSESNTNTAVAYAGQQTLKLDQRRTDAEFWRVLDFDFVAGRPFNQREVRDAAHVAVLNATTSRRYFGPDANAVGRTIEVDAVRYQVVGVVRDVPILRLQSYADVWVPITTTTDDLLKSDLQGPYQAIILAHSPADVPRVQAEYKQLMARQPVPDPKTFSRIESYALPLLADLTARHSGDEPRTGVGNTYVQLLLGLALLFMLLPALNLVNINVSRTLERSGEIGVRKAFGATAGRLAGQFLLENVFLTLLGGVLGLALAAGVLALLNSSHFIPYSEFALNGRVFAMALGLVLVFGVLSGAYPAYKLSRLQAVKALKGDLAV